MSATLKYMQDDDPQIVECGRLLSIGRSSSNGIVLTAGKVSRNHAVVRRLANEGYYAMDTGSSNGTFVNDERIIVPKSLKDGDHIRIGPTEITFHQHAGHSYDGESMEQTECGSTMTGTMQPEIRDVTVLVADIRGYTTLSERMEVGSLAKILSKWFRGTNAIVESHDGVVDKFIGDAVMARWISDDEKSDDAVLSALRTAIDLHEMTEALSSGNPDLPSEMKIGIGINTGRAAVGVVVSGHAQEFTVLGDSVNVAFRLESASKELKSDVVISRDACQHIMKSPEADRFDVFENSSQTINVKGKDEAIDVLAFDFKTLKAFLR